MMDVHNICMYSNSVTKVYHFPSDMLVSGLLWELPIQPIVS